MKISALIPWILAGSLAASTVCNVLLLQRMADLEAKLTRPDSATQTATALPGRIVSKLCLTKQQCNRIIDCSVH